jgi:hypothetical protein
MGERRTSEKSLTEYDDEALNEIDELTQRWQDRLTVDNLAFAERYIKCEMSLGMEVGLEENSAKKFVAVFKRKQVSSGVGGAGAWKVNLCEIGPHGNDRSVFIDDVQLIQTPKSVPLTSSIRLQPSQQFFDCGIDVREKRDEFLFGEDLFIPTYWKVDFIYNAFRCDALLNNERSSQTIKRRSEIVDNITDWSAPPDGNGLDYLKLINFYRGLRIFIDDSFVRIASHEGSNAGVKILQVFFGPVDLYPAT